MREGEHKKELIQRLQQQILSLQGCRSLDSGLSVTGLGELQLAFPNHTFPTGAVHEFISYTAQEASATNGFITALVGQLNTGDGACLWIGRHNSVFPPALRLFGLDPDRTFFVRPELSKHALWAVEEALKCESLSAVIGQLGDLSFTASRRLQLAVEQSRVTGFIHRFQPREENTTACVTRWKISPIPSFIDNGLPGVGLPRWQVQLLKVRNGKPGNWQMEWTDGGMRQIVTRQVATKILSRKTG